MKVIGAGYGRTGTLSMKVALEQLGFGPCYHMAEVVTHLDHTQTWNAANRGEAVDWRRFFEGWGSTVDFPSCAFYEQQMAAFPEAKVVLTVRDPERWYQSCIDTIFKVSTTFPMSLVGPYIPRMGAMFRMARAVVWERTFEGRFEDKAYAIANFNAHIEKVRATVPPERLLVFEVKQGWGPLCEFLQVPVPATPFPNVNDTAEFQRRFPIMNGVAWAVLVLPVVVIAGLVAWLV